MWNTCPPCDDGYHDHCTKRVLVTLVPKTQESSVPCDCQAMGHAL